LINHLSPNIRTDVFFIQLDKKNVYVAF
jgi:hypothetical protein